MTGPPCTYARECFSLEEARERRWILDEFNVMADFNIQNMYLQGLIVTEEPEGDKPRAFKLLLLCANFKHVVKTAMPRVLFNFKISKGLEGLDFIVIIMNILHSKEGMYEKQTLHWSDISGEG